MKKRRTNLKSRLLLSKSRQIHRTRLRWASIRVCIEPVFMKYPETNAPGSYNQLTSSTDCEASPTVVREPSSIFGGMVLSSSVRKNEGQDSPYLFRGGCVLGVCGVTCEGVGSPPAGPDTKTENDEPSAFGFISGMLSVCQPQFH